MASYSKPLPVVDRDSKPFWEAARRHQLIVQKCSNCGSFRWPPGPICFRCHSTDKDWVVSSGKGRVYTWAIAHQPLAGFEGEVPYAVVVVDIDDAPGIRLFGNVIGCKPEVIYEKMAVQAIFEDVTPEIALVRFRPD